jgi:hypothetical protein
MAVLLRHEAVIDTLLELKSDVALRAKDGSSVLHLACQEVRSTGAADGRRVSPPPCLPIFCMIVGPSLGRAAPRAEAGPRGCAGELA